MSPETNNYDICLKGHLDQRWMSWFEGLSIAHGFSRDGTPVTTLSGDLPDQAALHGALAKLRDIGIPILSINRVQSEKGEGK